ncbi:MAG: hypothetical protein OEW75_00400 [Cyclobacteriaceae bacterium]|nr:hypothetical protein [Cyclobacteriaceae bacterium]
MLYEYGRTADIDISGSQNKVIINMQLTRKYFIEEEQIKTLAALICFSLRKELEVISMIAFSVTSNVFTGVYNFAFSKYMLHIINMKLAENPIFVKNLKYIYNNMSLVKLKSFNQVIEQINSVEKGLITKDTFVGLLEEFSKTCDAKSDVYQEFRYFKIGAFFEATGIDKKHILVFYKNCGLDVPID